MSLVDTKKQSIREAYGLALAELGKQIPDFIVLDADVSKSTKTVYFSKEFPERFINFGIAEQNMMSAAAGMTTIGLIPIVNTFSFLTTYRAADQFRTSIVYPKLNVKVAANYAGLSDSYDGPTHQTISDIAWVRSLPNVCVIVPSDSIEIKKALPEIIKYNGPVWFRLCRAETPIIHEEDYEFKIGKAVTMRDGKDVTLIGCGVVLSRVLEAAEQLADSGYDPLVINMPTIKPLDEEAIIAAAEKTGAIVTIEEHNVLGGLGSAVCETVAKACPVPVERVGIPDTYAESGGYEQLLDKYGLAVEDIIVAVKKIIDRKRISVKVEKMAKDFVL